MNKILMFLLLVSSFAAFAQIPGEEVMGGDEAEALYTEEGYEQEMFMQKQEEASREPSEISEDSLEEEVYDSDIDYND